MQEPRQNAGAPTILGACRTPMTFLGGHLVNFGTPRGPPKTFFVSGNLVNSGPPQDSHDLFFCFCHYTDFMCGLIMF